MRGIASPRSQMWVVAKGPGADLVASLVGVSAAVAEAMAIDSAAAAKVKVTQAEVAMEVAVARLQGDVGAAVALVLILALQVVLVPVARSIATRGKSLMQQPLKAPLVLS